MSKDRRALLYVVFGAFALCALLTKSHATSWNDASRFATIDSLANRGTFAIENSSFARQTSDSYRYRGHTYGEPPEPALFGTAVAFALKGAGITPDNRRGLWIYLITLFVVGSSFSLGCGYAFAFARALGYSVHLSAFSAALSGAATLNLPYAIVYSNHVLVGTAVLAGVYHLFRLRDGTGHPCAAGLFFGLAFAFDQAAGFAALIAIIMLYRAPRSSVLVFLAASIPFVFLELFLNWKLSGSLLSPGLNDSFWSGAQLKATSLHLKPARDYVSNLASMTIGNKGLFVYTPLTFVCVFGLAKLWSSGKADLRRLTAAIVAGSALYFILMVLFTFDSLSSNYGERRFVEIFFILCVGLAPAIASLRAPLARLAALIAAVVSIVMAALGTVNPFAGQGALPGYVIAAGEFRRLFVHAPLQAGIDLVALLTVIALAVRFWPAPDGTPRQSLAPPAAT